MKSVSLSVQTGLRRVWSAYVNRGSHFLGVLAIGTLLVCSATINAATFVVTSAADTDGTTCGANCTLRQAINAANATVLSDTIQFNITGGSTVLTPQTQLPEIRNGLFINGYSQPGSAQNTSPDGFNGVVVVRISGTDDPFSAGLRVNAPLPVTISGVAITGFNGNFSGNTGRAIELGGSGAVNIRGCLIGVLSNGQTLANHNGIRVLASQTGTVTIGSNGADANTNRANRNVISANTNIGVIGSAGAGRIQVFNSLFGALPILSSFLGNGAANLSILSNDAVIHGNAIQGSAVGMILAGSGFTVTGNLIGRDSGDVPAAANDFGIRIQGASAGTGVIGGAGTMANRILQNTNDAIEHSAAGMNVDFALNQITFGTLAAGELPIDLVGVNGFESNDALDPDVGPNGLQNRPQIVVATRPNPDVNTPITVSGNLNSLPNTSFRIEFHGNRGGLGDVTTALTTDANGNGTFGPLSVVVADEIVDAIGATATRLDGVSGVALAGSERGPGTIPTLPVLPVTFTINSTADPGTGTCDAAECTLREAIIAANANNNAAAIDLIRFAIPGAGPHVIQVTSPLPAIDQAAEIDGYTQSGATPNTDASGVGSNAVLRIEVRGGSFHMMDVTSGGHGVIVRGLSITGFNPPFTAGGFGLDGPNARFEGNWVGVRPDGTEVPGRLVMGLDSVGGVLGGDLPAQRNIFVNQQEVIVTKGRAVNNLFGVLPNGRTAASVNVLQNVTGNESALRLFGVEGQTRPIAERNVFSTPAGFPAVWMGDADLIDNSFGESWDRTSVFSLGHAARVRLRSTIRSDVQRIRGALDPAAIDIDTSNLLGPIVIDHPIVGGAGVGVLHSFSSNVSIRGPMFGMASIPIDLEDGNGCNPSCVTPNDPGDTDPGSNGQQNFPVLAAAFRASGLIHLTGSLDSLPNRQYRIVICGGSTPNTDAHGPCELVLDEAVFVTTNGGGLADIDITLDDVPTLQFLTASAALITTMDTDEQTSEYSQNVPITVEGAVFADGFE